MVDVQNLVQYFEKEHFGSHRYGYGASSPIVSAEMRLHSIFYGYDVLGLPRKYELSTFVIKFPRRLLPEFNTHRKLSRNSASNRAIPVKKMIDSVLNDPAVPLAFYKNQPGMSGAEVFRSFEEKAQYDRWNASRLFAAEQAKKMMDDGVHKTEVNDLLAPFVYHTVLFSTTELQNFLRLRDAPDARPEMQILAKAIRLAHESSEPKELKHGEWHIPFIRNTKEDSTLDLAEKLKVSAGRCARISYMTHDGVRDTLKDISLFESLHDDKHESPIEHQARAFIYPTPYGGNFDGFQQLRKLLEVHGTVEDVLSYKLL